MKKHYRWNVKKFISNLILLLSLLGLLWVGLSYVEIIIKNVNPNPQYSMFNLFTLLVERIG